MLERLKRLFTKTEGPPRRSSIPTAPLESFNDTETLPALPELKLKEESPTLKPESTPGWFSEDFDPDIFVLDDSDKVRGQEPLPKVSENFVTTKPEHQLPCIVCSHGKSSHHHGLGTCSQCLLGDGVICEEFSPVV
jgi:hypothetical protein